MAEEDGVVTVRVMKVGERNSVSTPSGAIDEWVMDLQVSFGTSITAVGVLCVIVTVRLMTEFAKGHDASIIRV